MFLLLFQIATSITAADFSCFYLSFSPCYLITLQDSKKTCDPEGLLAPVVYEIKMTGIVFILILPNRHCSLVEYTVNVVHG